MKKQSLVFLAAILFIANIYAQSPNWQWAKSAGGANDDTGRSIAADSSGNVYVTGYFGSDSIIFGTNTFYKSDFGALNMDFFLVKHDIAGNVIWAKTAGGTNIDVGTGVATDVFGNIYVTGYFSSDSITFGATTLINVNPVGQDIFLVKYDGNGNVQWAESFGSSGYDEGLGITTDALGNVYITGYFSSPTINFGATSLNNTGSHDMFVAKVDASGNALWAKSAGGGNAQDGVSVAANVSAGGVYVTGNSYGSNIIFDTTTFLGAGSYDIFIAKYDLSGNLQWAKSIGGTGGEGGTGVVEDASGNSYITGYFTSDSLTFGSTTLVNDSANTNDIFIVKYDISGNPLWVKSAGGTLQDRGYGIAMDASGNISVIGYFESPVITFGAGNLTNVGSGCYDICIVKYNPSGNIIWNKSFGGSSCDFEPAIAIDVNGNTYTTGRFDSPVLPIGLTNLFNQGLPDIFVVKLSACSAYFTVHPDTIPHNWIAVNYASGAPPISYTWNWGDTTSSVGVAPNHVYNDSGYYNICLSIVDNNGCSAIYCDSSTYINRHTSRSSMITITVIDATNGGAFVSGNMKENGSLFIYPNPNEGMFRVLLNSALPQTTVIIYDITGQQLFREATNGQKEITVDVSELPAGIYILKAGQWTEKFVIE